MGRFLNRIGDAFLGALLGALVLITVSGVFMRYIMNAPLHWVEEMSGLLMSWIVFIGVYSAERDDENLSISFLLDALSENIQRVVGVLITSASVFVLVLTAYWGWGQAEAVQLRKTRILGVSLFWLYLPVVIGFAATAVLMLKRLLLGHKTTTGEKP